MFKKSLDIISLAAVAVFVGVAIWVAVWGESPREIGHISIQSKMIVADGVPFAFGVIWLIVRYANAAVARFPYLLGFSPGRPPRLFYFVNAAFAGWLIWNVAKGVWEAVERAW
jgi:hypothetical protein